MSNAITNVFIAEDDDDDYYIFSLVIGGLPVNVSLSRAENGEALMQMLDGKIPDILFLDLLMPRMDGFLCLKEIRKNARYDNMPVIILSSITMPQQVLRCYELRANRFVAKEPILAALTDKISTIFATGTSHASSFEEFTLQGHRPNYSFRYAGN